MTGRRLLGAGAVLCLLQPLAASAIPLGSGETVVLNGTNETLRPELGGAVLAEELRPFAISLGGGLGTLTGTLHDRVRRSDVTGRIIFERRILDVDDAGSGWGIVEIEIQGWTFVSFPGFVTTDVDFLDTSPGSVAPTTASRTDEGFESTSFHFANPVGAGEESRSTVNLTSTPFFGTCCSLGVLWASDGMGSRAGTGLVVFGAVPEPSAALLVLAALAAVAARLGRLSV